MSGQDAEVGPGSGSGVGSRSRAGAEPGPRPRSRSGTGLGSVIGTGRIMRSSLGSSHASGVSLETGDAQSEGRDGCLSVGLSAKEAFTMWKKITVKTNDAESLAAELAGVGVEGALHNSDGTLSLFVNEESEGRAKLESLLESWSAEVVEVEDVVEENWIQKCEDVWQREQIGAIEIVPVVDDNAFSKADLHSSHAEYPLYILPGLGFGTGHHPSTKLALTLMQDPRVKSLKTKHALDVGAGSGILAIAAVKLYEKSLVDAYEIEPSAISNARKNVALNEMEDSIELYEEAFEIPKGRYQLIFSNLYTELLNTFDEAFDTALLEGGLMIFSGITSDNRDELVAHYQSNGWEFHEHLEDGEWNAYLVGRGGA